MQIKSVEITNFRAKEKLSVDLGSRLTLLVGENGSGKTTILDAISIGLGSVYTQLPKVSGIALKLADILQSESGKATYARIKLKGVNGIEWDRTLRRDKSQNTLTKIPDPIGLAQLRKYIDQEIINPFNAGKEFVLPVYSYYGVSRALLDVPLRRRGFPKDHLRFESLENALNSSSRFRTSFVWFYNKENEEQRKIKELRDFDYKLPELEAVRKAIITVFPDLSDPHIVLNPLRFAVKMRGTTLDIMQLSDGYKTLLSLVIDLASRMALANPHIDNPLEIPATVLIDEIDLHLHPEWQRRVIGDLLRAFPNTQFILSTHSPYIVESVNNYLMRYHIRNHKIDKDEIQNIPAVDSDTIAAYHITDSDMINIIDKEIRLIDDKLIHPFNAISELYEQMRDIQWSEEL